MTAVFLPPSGGRRCAATPPGPGAARCVLIVAVFNCVSVWIGVTFSSYHGHAWLIIGWGSYVGFLVVMLILSVTMLRRPYTKTATSIPDGDPRSRRAVAARHRTVCRADRSSIWHRPPAVPARLVPAGPRLPAGPGH